MNDLAILIGLISFPGLVATVICDKVLVHMEPWPPFRYLMYTFMFGVGSYLVLQLFSVSLSSVDRHIPFLSSNPILSVWSVLLDTTTQPSWGEIAWATLFAPFVAAFTALVANKKWVNRLAQKFRISDKYGDENLFSYYLNSPDVQWVYVRDVQRNLSYRGLVKSFSETKEIQEIVLTNVTVFDYEESEELYRVETLYVSQPLGLFIIETPETSQSVELCHDDEEKKPTARGEGPKRSERGRDADNQHPTSTLPASTTATQEEIVS